MLQVHERLGDFEIIRLLGKGGMGEVYEARQFNPDRRVALKVLAPWLLHDEEALQRFLREAAVPANLDHPGIVHIRTRTAPPPLRTVCRRRTARPTASPPPRTGRRTG